MILAIDFDDTIHDRSRIETGRRMGVPKEGVVIALKRFVEEGHTIIIFTAHDVQNPAAYKAIEDWMNYFNLPFSGITNIKSPSFDLIIDNRALHFDSWPQVLTRINSLQASSSTYYDFVDESYKEM